MTLQTGPLPNNSHVSAATAAILSSVASVPVTACVFVEDDEVVDAQARDGVCDASYDDSGTVSSLVAVSVALAVEVESLRRFGAIFQNFERLVPSFLVIRNESKPNPGR